MIINGKDIVLIAEVKTCSPFRYESEESWEELFEIANKVGDIISIHTDERWGGSFELIRKAKELTGKPILAKGIHSKDEDIKKAVELGADYVLVVGRVPKVDLDKCLIEATSLEQLSEIPQNCKVVWNSRDILKSLELGREVINNNTFEQAREIWKGWLCQASNIRTIKDVKEGADAILVGTHLKEFVEGLKAV